MILIAHRGNVYGRTQSMENTIEYTNMALDKGYDVEVDVNYYKEHELLYLGHNKNSEIIEVDFLKNKRLWCHCKTLDALELCRDNNIPNYFWHQRDAYTLTSSGYIWAFPGEKVNKNTIVVCRDTDGAEGCAGICSNYVELFK